MRFSGEGPKPFAEFLHRLGLEQLGEKDFTGEDGRTEIVLHA